MVEMPPFEKLIRMPVAHSVPGMETIGVRRDLIYAAPGGESLTMDVYQPSKAGPESRFPAVLLIHGGPIPKLGARNMAVFTSYGRLLAASGFVAVTFNHRFLAPERLLDAASDVEAALAYARAHADELALDADRIAFWAFSGGGVFLSLGLRGAPPYVRALIAYYSALDFQEGASVSDRALSPVRSLQEEPRPVAPILVARAGRDHPSLNATVDRFVRQCLAANACLDLLNHPTGRHGFDFLDDDARTHEIIARTLEFLKRHVAAPA